MYDFPCGVSRVVHVIVLLSAVAISAPAEATDRFFSDIHAASPDGHYRLDATSPDNAKARRVPFQRDFTYTLTNTIARKVLWSRTQPKNGEAAPERAWVHDKGGVVILTGWNELMIFSPTTSTPVGVVNILKQFPKDEYDAHIHQTSAGPMWSASSRWYFLELGGRTHFVVRAWWGRRVIVDLTTGAVVPDQGSAHDAAIAAETADVLAILERASKLKNQGVDPTTGERDSELVSEVGTAAHLAGLEQVKGAIPFLFEIEKWDVIGCRTIGSAWLGEPLPEESVDPSAWTTLSVRATAQTALRRLGRSPAGLPATEFKYYHKDYHLQEPVEVTLGGKREDRVVMVKVGMSPLEVLRAISAPDDVVSVNGGRAWEYDIDAVDPYTLRVEWTRASPPTVSNVSERKPPAWKQGYVRDDRLAPADR